jgi:hypothetical protein
MAFELSVFLENKVAHFEKVTALLREEDINIRSLSMNSLIHGWGVLKLLVDQPEKAYQLLTKNGNAVSMQEVIALKMEDETGGLDEVLLKVVRAGIYIENAYTRLITEQNMAVLLIEVPDVLEAVRRLEINHVKFLDDKVVYGK